MEYYATFLDLNKLEYFSVTASELYISSLQNDILGKVLCGTGPNEHSSFVNAMRFLINEGLMFTCRCDLCAFLAVEKSKNEKDALRQLWIASDDKGKQILFSLPKHENDTLDSFCDHYNLSLEARRELAIVFERVLATELENKSASLQEA